MNQFTPRQSVDNMACLSNEGMADMHMACSANGNARGAARLYHGRFLNRYLPGNRRFANLHRRLRENGGFNWNRRGSGRPRKLRDAVEEGVL